MTRAAEYLYRVGAVGSEGERGGMSEAKEVERLRAEREYLLSALDNIVAHYEEAGENLEVMEAEYGPNYAAGFYEALGRSRDVASLAAEAVRRGLVQDGGAVGSDQGSAAA